MTKRILSFLFAFCPLIVHAQITNDSSHQAIEVFCGDFVQVFVNGADADLYDPTRTCNAVMEAPGVWYSIEGTGDILQFIICGFREEMVVFEENQDSLICIEEKVRYYQEPDCNGGGEALWFNSEIGKTYFVYCNSSDTSFPPLLQVRCSENTITNN